MAAYLRGVTEALDALRVERFALYGFSTGAALAMALARQMPQRVSHLILSGVPYWAPGEIEQFKSQVGRRELGGNGEYFIRVWQSMAYIAPTPDLRPQLHMAVVEALRVYDHYLDGLIAVTDYDLRPELAAATCPVLLLSSADDKLRPFTERAAAALPHAPYTMFAGSHSHLPWTAPVLFADHVRAFMADRYHDAGRAPRQA